MGGNRHPEPALSAGTQIIWESRLSFPVETSEREVQEISLTWEKLVFFRLSIAGQVLFL